MGIPKKPFKSGNCSSHSKNPVNLGAWKLPGLGKNHHLDVQREKILHHLRRLIERKVPHLHVQRKRRERILHQHLLQASEYTTPQQEKSNFTHTHHREVSRGIKFTTGRK